MLVMVVSGPSTSDSPGNAHGPEAARAPEVFGQCSQAWGGIVEESWCRARSWTHHPYGSLLTQDILWILASRQRSSHSRKRSAGTSASILEESLMQLPLGTALRDVFL